MDGKDSDTVFKILVELVTEDGRRQTIAEKSPIAMGVQWEPDERYTYALDVESVSFWSTDTDVVATISVHTTGCCPVRFDNKLTLHFGFEGREEVVKSLIQEGRDILLDDETGIFLNTSPFVDNG